jgi:hypothetical protein
MMEWIRPAGIGIIFFFAFYFGDNAVSRFHILGPFVAMLFSGTVAFESLFLGEIASEKIGYKPDRTYQIQSGLANLATAVNCPYNLYFELGNICRLYNCNCDVIVFYFFGYKSSSFGNKQEKL